MAVFSGVSTMRQESEQSMWEGSVPGDTAEGRVRRPGEMQKSLGLNEFRKS